MKRTLSLIIAAAMLVCGMSIAAPVSAAGTDELHFADASVVCETQNASAVYDANYSAVAIKPLTASVSTSVTLDLVGLADGTYSIVAWFPSTSCYDGVSFTAGEADFAASAGYKFGAYAIGTSGDSLTLTFTPESADTFFIYGVAAEAAGTMTAEANGSLDGIDISDEKLNHYDVGVYTQNFWEGGIVYNESFYNLTEADGSLEPIRLMYDVDRVVSVRNSYLNVEYTYGVDYTFSDGKLVVLPDGAMNIYNYSNVFRDTQLSASWRKTIDGNFAYCGQLNMYFVGYYNVTYTHTDTWQGPKPESKAYLLQNSVSKLEAGETVKLLSVGDSLAGGANASADLNVAPYADVWCDMVAKDVQLMYPSAAVQTQTIAQGGATASLCIEKMSEIIAYAPDLIFIEFGTNECMQGDDPSGYIETLTQAIEAIKAAMPECDIVLVAPIISNPIFFDSNIFYAYADALYSLEGDGVAAANVTSELQYMLTRKDYIDMTGDFLCHPNDFVSRVFVQTIAETLTDSTVAQYKESLAARLSAYRYEADYPAAQWAEICTIVDNGSAAINAASDRDGAKTQYLAYAAQIDAVQTTAEILASSNLDLSKLIFNSTRAMDAVSTVNNINTKYDADEPAMVMTISSARNAYQYLDYGAGTNPVSADSFDYAVVTMKAPLTNGASAKAEVFTFETSSGTLPAKSVNLTLDGKYHSYIIDLSAEANWTGTVDNVKMNFAACSTGDHLYVSSIVLCADAEAASDTAIERERSANADAAVAATTLFCDSTVTAGLTVPAAVQYIAGDVDANGKLNAKDALLLKLYIAESDIEIANERALDVDESGTVDAADSLLVKKMIAHVISTPIVNITEAVISYNNTNDAAEITTGVENATVTYDLDGAGYTADMFKYVTVCMKNKDGSAIPVTVCVTTENGTAKYTVNFDESSFFEAQTAKFVNLTGAITSVSFTFETEKDTTVFFDSFVLTPTLSAAQNAETVRVGAANLI